MNTWTIADFITYIYQVVADADLQATEEEVGLLKRQVGQILAKHFDMKYYNYAVSLQKIQQADDVSLLNCMEVIKSNMPLFEFSKEAKEDILHDLDMIASSDDQVTPAERATIAFIKQQFMTVNMPLSW